MKSLPYILTLILVFMVGYYSTNFYQNNYQFDVDNCFILRDKSFKDVIVCQSTIRGDWLWDVRGLYQKGNQLIVLQDTNMQTISHEVSHHCYNSFRSDEDVATCTGILTQKIHDKFYDVY